MPDHSSTPSSASGSAVAYLEIQDEQGVTTQTTITGPRTIIGRSEQASIKLDSEDVSRLHVEVFCDPFGRWWLRDLGSRNGTTVNGQLVSETVLRPHDWFDVGPFRLQVVDTARASRIFRPDTPPPDRPAMPVMSEPSSALVDSDASTLVAGLSEVASAKVDMAHLTRLNTFASRISRISDPARRLNELCKLMVRPDFHGVTVLAVRLDRENKGAAPQIIHAPMTPSGDTQKVPHLSESLLRVVSESEAPALAAQGSSEAGAVTMTLVPGTEGLAAIACPLRTSPDEMDVLYVLLPAGYGTGEWLALIAHAVRTFQQIESALEAQRQLETLAMIENDLARASQIQGGLLPRTTSVAGLDLAVGFQPCRWVGGDYVDVMQTPGGRILLAIADVSGKGLSAALVASTVHSIVHTTQRAGLGLRETMTILSEHLCSFLHDSTYVTMVGMIIEPASGAFEVANAAHPAPLVIAPDGSSVLLQHAANLPLGIPECDIVVEEGMLGEGHLLAMFTDGLTELTDSDNRQLGPDGISECLSQMYTSGDGRPTAPDEVAEQLKAKLDDYQGNRIPADDRTFLLARRA